MYQIKLGHSDMHRLRIIIKQMMLKNELTRSDLSRMTGYSKSTIDHFFAEGEKKLNSNRQDKFVAAALCDVLDIAVGERR